MNWEEKSSDSAVQWVPQWDWNVPSADDDSDSFQAVNLQQQFDEASAASKNHVVLNEQVFDSLVEDADGDGNTCCKSG